jgi:hypothetical protein
VRLCGQISIELSAGDFVEAADHLKRLEEILGFVREAYPQATLAVRERRRRKMQPDPQAPRVRTGALKDYLEESAALADQLED